MNSPSTCWARASIGPRIKARQAQIDAQRERGGWVAEIAPAVYSKPATWLGGKELLSIDDAAVIYGLARSKIERWLRDGKITRHRMVGLPTKTGRPVSVAVDPVEIERLRLTADREAIRGDAREAN